MQKLIIIVLLVFPIQLIAQTVTTGGVFDYAKKSIALPGVTVRNLNNKKVTLTNNEGKFVIGASVGEILEFSLIGYHTDTLYVTNLLTKIIYLPVKSTSLNDVTVEGVKINKEIANAKDPLAEKYTLLNTGGNLDRKVMTDKVGGLTLNLGYGKYKREQQKEILLQEKDAYRQEINANFNETSVKELTKLDGEELKNFIVIYSPSVEKVQSERPFKYNYYIAQAYQAWLKLPLSQRKLKDLPKLEKN
ncbi:hypothetical protein EZJ43_12760 [Pedobacter changchengzhani]|uniref:Carboxypeptidase-like regulatory domain-containing protein n=1 Tax=Pedobacter changchengzhani TaxID=2529274 RepID=A0A4R5MIZ8_9SPHI|nr:carboxypeptidase-like regulatory domain-containing protein [Pedobacter changchengzhani]TDG35492.1 hypothetical protein EZJ43_12760 [Pedobacter changchengzhani]